MSAHTSQTELKLIGKLILEGEMQCGRRAVDRDGMGRSDTREALRRFFEIDMGHVVVAVLTGLLEAGEVDASVVDDAIRRYDIDPDAADPYVV